jgi:hypothetical protein
MKNSQRTEYGIPLSKRGEDSKTIDQNNQSTRRDARTLNFASIYWASTVPIYVNINIYVCSWLGESSTLM